MAEAWQAQALAQAIGSRLAVAGPPELTGRGAGADRAGGPGLRGAGPSRPLRRGQVCAPPSSPSWATPATLCSASARSSARWASPSSGSPARPTTRGLYWQCMEVIDAADESRDRVLEMLRRLAATGRGGASGAGGWSGGLVRRGRRHCRHSPAPGGCARSPPLRPVRARGLGRGRVQLGPDTLSDGGARAAADGRGRIRRGLGLLGRGSGRRSADLEIRVERGQVRVERRHQLLHLLQQPLRLGGPACCGTASSDNGRPPRPLALRGGRRGCAPERASRRSNWPARSARGRRAGRHRPSQRSSPLRVTGADPTSHAVDGFSPARGGVGQVAPVGLTDVRPCRMEAWIFESSPSPSKGATYDTLLAVAKATEDLGFDAFFRSDHYLRMGVGGRPARPDRRLDHPRRTRPRDQAHPPRHPDDRRHLPAARRAGDPGRAGRPDVRRPGRTGPGRGLVRGGAQGVRHPVPQEKFARLEEQLAIVTGLWETKVGETFSYDGTHYQLTDSPALPKPAQAKVPVLIGGHGATRTPRLAARYADEFNMPFASIEDSERQFGRVRAAAEAAGRKADDLVYSNALVVCVGKDDAEVARRAAAIGREVDGAEGERAGRLPGRGRREDRPVRGRRLPADLPPDPRPRRPGPPGADLLAGAVAAVVAPACGLRVSRRSSLSEVAAGYARGAGYGPVATGSPGPAHRTSAGGTRPSTR